jgi:hypothetical protein
MVDGESRFLPFGSLRRSLRVGMTIEQFQLQFQKNLDSALRSE